MQADLYRELPPPNPLIPYIPKSNEEFTGLRICLKYFL